MMFPFTETVPVPMKHVVVRSEPSAGDGVHFGEAQSQLSGVQNRYTAKGGQVDTANSSGPSPLRRNALKCIVRRACIET